MSEQTSTRRFALIIANDAYDDGRLSSLQTPARDADGLARVLRDSAIGGFAGVEPIVNQKAEMVRDAIVRFFKKKERDDLLLLYFSGHGVRDDDDGSLHLAVKDTDVDVPSSRGIAAHFITREMDKSRVRRIVLIFDCCYSGAFDRGRKSTSVGTPVDVGAPFEGSGGQGRVVLTASSAVQVAWVGDEVLTDDVEHSLYTHYLIEGLETGAAGGTSEWITVNALHNYANRQVTRTSEASGKKVQTPQIWVYGQTAEIIISRNPRPAAADAISFSRSGPVELQRPSTPVTLLIPGDIAQFTSKREMIISSLSEILQIRPQQINILQVIEGGSVRVTIEMPQATAYSFHQIYLEGRPELRALQILGFDAQLSIPSKLGGQLAISLTKLPPTHPDLFGRERELSTLDAAWADPDTNVLTLVAWGGVGKTALVNKWLLAMSADGYRGAERVYGWSFSGQGAGEGRETSAAPFIDAALRWFGDNNPTIGSPWDKGDRLATLIRQRPTLLVLDGVEPLQYPPGEMEGRLKDPSLQSLLRGLARHNPGLGIITTRLAVDDLEDFIGTSVTRVPLEHLPPQAGVAYLAHLGVKGTQEELERAVSEFDGHALALTLLGRYLTVVHNGDVRMRDRIARLSKERRRGGHACRVMESYERWFKGKPELDILRIMGLFDRPAEGGAIEALRAEPPIEGLTTELDKLSHTDWQYAVNNLRDAWLLTTPDPGSPDTINCHPLVREYFGQQLEQDNPRAWREAHGRLYEYFLSQAKELPDTFEEMQPLYAAVAHGCQAGRYLEALHVYRERISRGNELFSVYKLNAVGADLAALSSFFDPPWRRPVDELQESAKAFVLGLAGFHLRALGRLTEAAQSMQAVLKADIARENWKNAAIAAGNLSEFYLTGGNLGEALNLARQSVDLADRSGDDFRRMSSRATLADALQQAGCPGEAEAAFREAEEMQRENQRQLPLLNSLQGFQYCDLLLGQGKYGEIQRRAGQTLEWAMQYRSLLWIALDHLSLGRAHLLQAQQEGTGDLSQATAHLKRAVDGLRQAGHQEFIARGLLARAELRRVAGSLERARDDLVEALSIAARGGMRLHEADCHLGYARLHLACGERGLARESLDRAKGMVKEMRYRRRDGEMEELEEQLAALL